MWVLERMQACAQRGAVFHEGKAVLSAQRKVPVVGWYRDVALGCLRNSKDAGGLLPLPASARMHLRLAASGASVRLQGTGPLR